MKGKNICDEVGEICFSKPRKAGCNDYFLQLLWSLIKPLAVCFRKGEMAVDCCRRFYTVTHHGAIPVMFLRRWFFLPENL